MVRWHASTSGVETWDVEIVMAEDGNVMGKYESIEIWSA